MAVNIGSAVAFLELDTSKFTKGFANAKKDLGVFKNETATAGDKLTAVGNVMGTVGSTLTKSLTVPILGISTASVKVASDFDTSMSQVASTMGLTVEEINHGSDAYETLRKSAKEAGRTTAFSASQASEALNYMALAGYTVEQSTGNLKNVLNLASAGAMDLGSASDLVTDAMSALGLEVDDTGENVGKFTDRLAKTSSITNTSVQQLGEGILTIGATARTVKGGTIELATALGILANNGIKGAEGGTHLRNMIMSLQTPTSQASKELEKLGISVYDSDGNFRSLNDIFGDLKKSMQGMTQEQKDLALGTIFNKTDMASVNALLVSTGDEFKSLQKEIKNSAGSAQEMADVQLNNLQGSVTILKSALEGAGITIGEQVVPYIKSLAEWITGLVTKFNELSPETQALITKFLLIVASIGPLLLIGSKLIALFGTITKVINVAKFALTFLGASIGIIPIAIMGVVAVLILLYTKCEWFRNGVNAIVKAVINFFKDMVEKIKSHLRTFSNNIEVLKTNIKNKFKEIEDKVRNMVNVFKIQFDELKQKLSNKFNEIKQKATDFINNFKQTIEQGVANAVKAFITKIAVIVHNVKELKEKLKTAGKQAFEGLLEGIKSVAEKITNFVSGLRDKISNIVSSITSKISGAKSSASSASQSINGSHADGLDYVPFDGYVAKLHKGERVLTKEEAKVYNKGQKQGGGDTFNFYNTKPNPYEYAKQIKRTKKELLYDF